MFAPITATHWGVFRYETDGRSLKLHPLEGDERPTPLLAAIEKMPFAQSRIRYPSVRAGFLEKGASSAADRGSDRWVRVSWSEALDLASRELNRMYDTYGPSAVFGHSYGWKQSGVLNSPSTLLRRMLALRGGYVRGENTYSTAAIYKILKYVVGEPCPEVSSWEMILKHSSRVVFWGCDPLITNDIDWTSTLHAGADSLMALKDAHIETIAVNPLKPDTAKALGSRWIPLRPGSDTALMLGMIHTLLTENLADRRFLAECTEGFERFEAYVMGREDGIVRDPLWAQAQCGVAAHDIRALARELAGNRTMLMLGWGPQRARFGEQFHWMGYALAACLGQIGLPGGGIGAHYHDSWGGAPKRTGVGLRGMPLPQTEGFLASPVIPVARFADALANPGRTIDFNGRKVTYPDIRLLIWSGGNPFAHQPDTLGLMRAWKRPECVIVSDTHWTPTAKMADIVLPACTVFERDDMTAISELSHQGIAAMHKILEPRFESRSDFWIMSELAGRLGVHEAFTEGLSEAGWLRRIYESARMSAATQGVGMPAFETFWTESLVMFPEREAARDYVQHADFRRDPMGHPLSTPSGRIEIYSRAIEAYGYADCPPHPAYLEPEEGVGRTSPEFPLSLISPKSTRRLHSQLDEFAGGGAPRREPVIIHVADAAARGIRQGDVVLVASPRGRILADADVTDEITPGTVAVRHGAWFDPQVVNGELIDVHGQANVLTADVPTSSLANGNNASTAVVQVSLWKGPVPQLKAFECPKLIY